MTGRSNPTFLKTMLLLAPLLVALTPANAELFERDGATVAVEPYGQGILRVTISTDRTQAAAGPGYGIATTPDARGWSTERAGGSDRWASAALSAVLHPAPPPRTQGLLEHYFSSQLPRVSLSFQIGRDKTLAMTRWSLAPHEVAGEKTFKPAAWFVAEPDEHFYGLGQNQEGVLDLAGRTIDCTHWYDAPAGEQVCMPLLISSRGYAILWDNPSATQVSPGLHGYTRFESNVGERVSFFVISGKDSDAIFAGVARLTGKTPMPPKAALGLIQSRARYATQGEMLADAEGYRQRGYPLDMIVLDWFYWTRMGQIDFDPKAFPSPGDMTRRFRELGLKSFISVWPRFERDSRYFTELASRRWLLADVKGSPVDGLPERSDRAGALIDATSPGARRWYWEKIRDNLFSQGFDFAWLDETEPDLVPDGYFYSIGSGDRYRNLFPLLHTLSVAEGSALDRPKIRNTILCRASYLGAQANGCLFWSSDVRSTWDALRRQVPAGLNASASAMIYWSSDTGGWQMPSGQPVPEHVLLDPAGATAMVPSYRDYPELFVRWFQYNSFTPILRVHGSRPASAIWTYGRAAEPILADWLRLRYALMPYIYPLARKAYDEAAPMMRPLWMDFGADPAVATTGDQYMFGPAFLVAPVTRQGATSRRVYLPAGTDWYDWWTNARYAGGQWIEAAAPIERMPLFVRAGSIVPLGVQVPSTATRQKLSELRIFPGRDGHALLYDDDGTTNAYRAAKGTAVVLRWDDQAQRLTASGTLPTGQELRGLMKIVTSPSE